MPLVRRDADHPEIFYRIQMARDIPMRMLQNRALRQGSEGNASEWAR